MRALVLGAVRQAIAVAMKSRHSFDHQRNSTFMPIA
jgi:hypothetical protein